MLIAELREPTDGDSILLIEPRELEPELALGGCDSDEAARCEHAQSDVAIGGELAHQRLQLAQLVECAAGEELRGHGSPGQTPRVRSTSSSAVVLSRSAITAQ